MAEEDEQTQNKKQKNNENEKLWQDLNIHFRLEAFKFPDNKIYGTIEISPESSRKLIKKCFLVVNKTNRIEFDPHYTQLSASGFNTNKKDPSAYIEAIPSNAAWAKKPKTSKICYFFFTGEVFTLSPVISFDWSNDETAILIIKWYHIGDKLAHKYILILDNIEVQYIRQKLIDDAFDIRISGFQAGEKHTFQLAAKLNNGKETYRSDLIEFIVPNKSAADTAEFITVSNEPPPPDLPAYIATKEDKTEEDFHPEDDLKQNQKKGKEDLHQNQKKVEENLHQTQKKEETLNPNPNPLKPTTKPKQYTCCDHLPHKTFPGIEHYFNNIQNKFSSSDTSENDTDDDDVITPKN